MLVNIITTELAAAFFILCVLCVMTEKPAPKKASLRNFMRRIRITLREINLLTFLIISAALIAFSLKTDIIKPVCALFAVVFFALGLFVLNSFHILNGRGSRKLKKKLRPLGWILPSKEAGYTPEAKILREASEAPLSSELSERTSL